MWIPALTFCKADICDPEIHSFFDGVDGVFHLAAKNCLSECLKDPLGSANVNVLGTLNVLEAARKANVRKVIYADTSAEHV